jgi:hypothetical protein
MSTYCRIHKEKKKKNERVREKEGREEGKEDRSIRRK